LNSALWRLHLSFCVTDAGSIPLTWHLPAHAQGTARRLLIIPPLFEEMNRSRAFLANVGRELASLNIATLLPDLPGTGDCGRALEHICWQEWQEALHALVRAEKPDHILAMRGGALLAQHLHVPRDDFAPVKSGQIIWRALARARMVMEQESGHRLSQAELESSSAQGQTLLCAGYALNPLMVRGLQQAHITQPAKQTWHLNADGLEGPPIWLQAEPLAAPDMAQRLAALLCRSMA